MIRAPTFHPHHVGGLTFRHPDGFRVRVNAARNSTTGEGSEPRKVSDDWMGGRRRRHISWWREARRNRRETERAVYQNDREGRREAGLTARDSEARLQRIGRDIGEIRESVRQMKHDIADLETLLADLEAERRQMVLTR